MGPRSNLYILEKRKIFCICWDSYPGSSSLQPNTILTMLSWIILTCSKESKLEIILKYQRKHLYIGRGHKCECSKKIPSINWTFGK